jgi:hypothetical protein
MDLYSVKESVGTCFSNLRKEGHINDEIFEYEIDNAYYKKCLSAAIDKSYYFVKVLGRGTGGNATFQICSSEEACYVLKIATKQENGFSTIASDHGIGPKVIESFPSECYPEEYSALVMEKMDGTLLDFYPFPIESTKDIPGTKEILMQVFELIVRSVVECNIFQADTKLGNLLYKRSPSGNVEIFLADYDIAKKALDADLSKPLTAEQKERLEIKINILINFFAKAYLSPGDYDTLYINGKKIYRLEDIPKKFERKYLDRDEFMKLVKKIGEEVLELFFDHTE